MWDYCITEVETAAFTWRHRATARPLRLFASQLFTHFVCLRVIVCVFVHRCVWFCVCVCVCEQQCHVFQD